MRAAVLREFKAPLLLEQRREPVTHGEEVLVRVRGAGVCRTDVHIVDGYWPKLPLPRVLGHEIAGEAQGIGPVLVYASWGCRSCVFCARGEEQLCPNAAEAGWVRDGGYAEFVVVPSRRYLLPLEGLDPVRAAPLADAGLTPYRAVQRARPWLRPGASAVVLGVGGLGQFAIQYVKLLTAAHVVAVDPSEAKRVQAVTFGADDAFHPDEVDQPARAVFDFVGSDTTLALATRIVERTGIVIQIGEMGGTVPFGLSAVPHEAHLTSSIWGSFADLTAVLDMARRGDLRWHVETLPLEQVNEGLDRLRRGDVLGRLVLTP